MMQNASFYLSDPTIIGQSLFASLDPSATFRPLAQGELASGFTVEWDGQKYEFSIMGDEALPTHLEGLDGWLQQSCKDAHLLTAARARLHYTKLCLGCRFSARDETLQNAIFSLNDRFNSLAFYGDTLFNFDGAPLAGYFHLNP
jgi:hypothetical protein